MKQKTGLYALIMCLSLFAASVMASVSTSSSQSQPTLMCSDFDIVIGKI